MFEQALQRIQAVKENRHPRLDLCNCQLTELPKELFELYWLEELILNSERYEDLDEDPNAKLYAPYYYLITN